MSDIVTMYLSGMSCSEIARQLGRPSEAIRLHLKRAGIERRLRTYRKPRPTPTWDEYFGPRTEKVGDCILWTGCKDKAGYGIFNAWFARGHSRVHRVSYLLTHGPFDRKLKVLHRCDVRNCVNPDHLWLGTQIDNINDMVAKGRQRSGGCIGEVNGGAKLTDELVQEIRRERHDQRTPYYKLAERLGVSTMTIYRACVGQAWAHIDGAVDD